MPSYLEIVDPVTRSSRCVYRTDQHVETLAWSQDKMALNFEGGRPHFSPAAALTFTDGLDDVADYSTDAANGSLTTTLSSHVVTTPMQLRSPVFAPGSALCPGPC